MVPVAAVAVAPVVFFTVPVRVTVVPWSWGLAGLTEREVVVDVAGAGGSGSVPCRASVRPLPLLPENRVSSDDAASAHVLVEKLGIEKVVSDRSTSLVVVLYGEVDWRTRCTGVALQVSLTGEVIFTWTVTVSSMVT